MNHRAQRILNEVTAAYIEAAYFTDTGEPEQCSAGTPLADVAQLAAAETCADFLRQCIDAELLSAYFANGRTCDQLGHDYWLTRNGHGAGFWDRGDGVLGDRLAELARGMGSRGLYEGDDGRAYFE